MRHDHQKQPVSQGAPPCPELTSLFLCSWNNKSSWLPWLYCPPHPAAAPWQSPFKGFPGPTSTRPSPPPDLPFLIQCILNSLGRRRLEKCQVLSSQGTDGSVCPHPFQNGSLWQKLTSAAMSVEPAPSVILFPSSPRSQQRTFFFPQL